MSPEPLPNEKVDDYRRNQNAAEPGYPREIKPKTAQEEDRLPDVSRTNPGENRDVYQEEHNVKDSLEQSSPILT